MTENSTNIVDKKIKILGIYQIIGGIAGIVMTLWLVAQTPAISGLILLIYFLAFGLYSYSIYCGKLILKGIEAGLVHSMINQLLQLVNFALLGYGFKYVSGMLMSIGIDFTTSFEFKLYFGILSTWEINVNSDNNKIALNLNLLALFVIMFIDKLRSKRPLHKSEAQFQ